MYGISRLLGHIDGIILHDLSPKEVVLGSFALVEVLL